MHLPSKNIFNAKNYFLPTTSFSCCQLLEEAVLVNQFVRFNVESEFDERGYKIQTQFKVNIAEERVARWWTGSGV